MEAIEEEVQVSDIRRHSLSLRTLTWATILIMATMAALYMLFRLPPSFESFYAKMYFHSIGIGIAALATFLVISIYHLRRHEPPLDFPLHYRAFAAVLFAAAGGILYLSPTFDSSLPDVALGLFVVAFILIGDVGGALLIELLFLPRKLAGTYSSTEKQGLSLGYFLRMLPSKRSDLSAYRRMDATYWLVLFSVGSAFIAGLIGIVNLWVSIFGQSFLASYLGWLGTDANGFLAATLDPHSHEIALAIMGGVVALTAKQFGVADLAGLKRRVATAGLWIASIGVITMSIVLVAVAFANFSPPTLLQSSDGINGIAGDDAAMSIIALGAMITLVPLALTRFLNKSSWKDSVRFAILETWIAAVIINVLQGFYIEMHEDAFSTTMSSNDASFSSFQPLVGVFMLTATSLVLLAVDYHQAGATLRRSVGWASVIGTLTMLIGGAWATFLSPVGIPSSESFLGLAAGTWWNPLDSFGDPTSWFLDVGMLVIGIATVLAVRGIQSMKVTPSSVASEQVTKSVKS